MLDASLQLVVLLAVVFGVSFAAQLMALLAASIAAAELGRVETDPRRARSHPGVTQTPLLDVVGDALGAGVASGGRVAEEALPQRAVGQVDHAAVFHQDVEDFVGRSIGSERLFARLPALERLAFVAAFQRVGLVVHTIDFEQFLCAAEEAGRAGAGAAHGLAQRPVRSCTGNGCCRSAVNS